MRVIVTGSRYRKFEDRALIFEQLDYLHKTRFIELLIQGGAMGVDQLASTWAIQNGIPCATVNANWVRYGLGAGPVRNEWMAKLFYADLLAAFPGGSGTQDMIEAAIRHGIEVVQFVDVP